MSCDFLLVSLDKQIVLGGNSIFKWNQRTPIKVVSITGITWPISVILDMRSNPTDTYQHLVMNSAYMESE
jgi:hypothetical protein